MTDTDKSSKITNVSTIMAVNTVNETDHFVLFMVRRYLFITVWGQSKTPPKPSPSAPKGVFRAAPRSQVLILATLTNNLKYLLILPVLWLTE